MFKQSFAPTVFCFVFNASFEYDNNGDRTSKITGTSVTETILDNGSISADLIGDELKVYTPDNSVYYYNGNFEYNVINIKGDLITNDLDEIKSTYTAFGQKTENVSQPKL